MFAALPPGPYTLAHGSDFPPSFGARMDKHPAHDLHENDLESFLANFGEFWKKHGKGILLAILLVLLVLVVWRFRAANLHRQHESQWTDLSRATSPNGFMEVEEHAEGSAKYLALLGAGELWLQRAAMPMASTDTETELQAEEKPEDMLRNAARAYQQVLDASDAPLPMRLDAMLGLAAVAESEQRWDDAAKHYDQVIKDAGENYPMHATRAQRRKAMLDHLKQPVAFAPKPAETPKAPETPVVPEIPLEQPASTPEAEVVTPAPVTPPAETQPTE